jgi:molybdenum cofactor cytidylyltransferase
MPVAAIIVAAGASTRLGRPKQLVSYRGETLLARAIRLAGEAGAAPVLVVLGAHSEAICAGAPLGDATGVINERWAEGISTSIHVGLRAVDAGAAGVLVIGCDQPHLTVGHLLALIEAFAGHSETVIAGSSYAGVVGIPAIFPRSVFGALHALRGDKGARALLVHPPCPLITLPFAGGEIDIDLPADLANLE